MIPMTAYADAGFDNASYQGCYDAQTAKSNGASFSITKLTELNANRNAGLRMAAYDFARPEYGYSAIQSADNFDSKASQYGIVHAGVIPVIDWEPGGGRANDVAWAKMWLDRVSQYWGTKPLIYMSANTITLADWSPVANANYGLWVAGYPRGYAGDRLRDPGAPPYSLGPWPFAAAWQYSSSGNVPGVGNAVDVDWFYGDAVTWAKYANASIGSANNPVTPNNTPSTGAPTADPDTLATNVIRGEYGNDPQRRALLGDKYAAVMAIVNRRLVYGQAATTGGSCVVVRGGDTLSGIANRTGYQPYSAWHGYRSGNPNVIYAGETVCYGGASRTEQSGRYIVISAGDNLWNHFGANSYAVARANGIPNANMVRSGQVIRY